MIDDIDYYTTSKHYQMVFYSSCFLQWQQKEKEGIDTQRGTNENLDSFGWPGLHNSYQNQTVENSVQCRILLVGNTTTPVEKVSELFFVLELKKLKVEV